MIVVAAYDIADDGRRSRVAAVLQSVGDRIQKSVFLIDVSAEVLAEVRARVAAIMDPERDSLYVFTQCRACWQGVHCIGQASPPEKEVLWTAF